MDRKISSDDKFSLQQNFRRYLKFQEQFETASEAVNNAKSSRVWIVGVISLLFAFSSEFFLGAAAALIGLYLYRIAKASMKAGDAEEGKENTERWFSSKGLKFEGRILYFTDDNMLDNPLDPFDDNLFA